MSLLGGRAAEKLVLNDISTGASNDIERATAIARDMVMKFGMSDRLGPVSFASPHDEVFLGRDFASRRNFSEDIAAVIDSEVKNIVDSAYARCESILNENMEKLHEVAEYLIKHEVMEADVFYGLFNEEVPTNEVKVKQVIESASRGFRAKARKRKRS